MTTRHSAHIEPIEVAEALSGPGATAAKPAPPSTHPPTASTPSSPALSTRSSQRASFQSHGRTFSAATESSGSAPPSRPNRFSVTFPIQPERGSSPASTAPSHARDGSAESSTVSPTGPSDTNFLTDIATQERRVLELKEELGRAEADLSRLKRQWAQHEAQKKRNDVRSVTKLQPLQTGAISGAGGSGGREYDVDGSAAWLQQEMERRKALLNGNRASNRTVFSGSRHTRTLSLLSPVRTAAPAMPAPVRQVQRPPRKDSLSEAARRGQDGVVKPPPRPQMITRASTTPDLTVETVDRPTPAAAQQTPGEDQHLLHTGKKVVTDFRDGLWTFWEDLRQATVGEEATQLHPPRRQSSNQTLRTASKQTSRNSLRAESSRSSSASKTSTDTTKRPSPARKHTKSATLAMGTTPALADPSFWTENGVLTQQPSPAPVKKRAPHRQTKPPSKPPSVSSTEAWDAWPDDSTTTNNNSPHHSQSSSAVSETTTLPTSASNPTSPRPSTEAHTANHTAKPSADTASSPAKQASAKDPLPWPELSKLGPKALTRTASHLMSEWERSLTPSPGQEFTGEHEFLGVAGDGTVQGGWKKD